MSDRDDQDQPLSSEDLVKRAREELFGGEEPEDSRRGSDAPSSVSSSDDVTSSIDPVDEYAEFLRTTSDDVSGETASPEEPTLETPEPPADPDDERLERSWDAAPQPADRRSWDPDWKPGDPSPGYGSDRPVGGPDPSVLTPPTGSRRTSPGGGRIGGWVIGLVVFGGIALFNFLDTTTSVATLREGDCLEDPGLVEVIENVEAVDCDEPHEIEVFAVVEFDDPDGARFPGEDLLYEVAIDRCLPGFAGYVGTSYEESVYWVDAWTPVEEGWDRGDRGVLCVIYEVTDDFDIKSNTFSARNSRR